MIKGILFDFDGTIADTEESRFYAINKVLETFSLNLDINLWNEKYKRINTKEIFKDLTLISDKRKLNSLYKKEVEIRNEYIKKNGISFILGFENFYKEIKKRKIKTVICSGGSSEHLKFLMESLNIKNISYVSREDYKLAKPNPDCYLLGLERIKLNPNEVLVFDDSYNGLLAGLRSGCKVIGINLGNEFGVEKLDAQMIINNYLDLDLDIFFDKF